MAYDSARIVVADASLFETPVGRPADAGFDRSERIALLLGGAGLGATAGFAISMTLGYLSVLSVALIAAPLLLLALHLTSRTLTEAMSARAYGCATATTLHGAALLAWPMTALLAPLSPVMFWMAPIVAGSALIMVASCWEGSPRAVYRLSLQAMLVAAVTAQQGLMVVMGA